MLTLLMATLNRAESLRRVMETYASLETPDGGWKAVIIDNGSRDHTREVVESFQARLPVVYVREDAPGKTRALNRGLAHLEGDLVVMTDDDILPQCEWLATYRKLADCHADCSVFGGPIYPQWPVAPPAWAVSNKTILGACFGTTVNEHPSGPLPDFHYHLLGGNFAFRKQAIDAGYRFNPDIGVVGAGGSLGDETDFLQRLNAGSRKCWYSNDLGVEHIIREEQLRRRWVLKRGMLCGRGTYRLGSDATAQPRMLFGIPRHAVRQIGAQCLQIAKSSLLGDSAKTFAEMWRLSYYLGYAVEGRKLYGRP